MYRTSKKNLDLFFNANGLWFSNLVINTKPELNQNKVAARYGVFVILGTTILVTTVIALISIFS